MRARASSQGQACRPKRRRRSPGDVPDHIREDLSEELSGLPTELIYAANLVDFELSKSEAVNRAAEAHGSLVRHLDDLYGPAWPPEADDAARETWEEYCRARQRQLDAMKWVQENSCSTQGEGADEEAEAGEDAGEEAGEEADEEAGQRSSSDEEARASSQGQAGEG